jgi:hypothetical protein
VSPFGDFSAGKKDWSGLTLHKRIPLKNLPYTFLGFKDRHL